MSYRPITDNWILARPKVPYYGAYPAGFLERARWLLGASIYEPVLHVCGGQAKRYSLPEYGVIKGTPLWGYGPSDVTLDADENQGPDIVCNVAMVGWPNYVKEQQQLQRVEFRAVLADPPYTVEDADKYAPGRIWFPKAKQLLAECLELVPVGGRVGMLHYIWPKPPEWAKCVAMVSVIVGYNNRVRVFSVYERRGTT